MAQLSPHFNGGVPNPPTGSVITNLVLKQNFGPPASCGRQCGREAGQLFPLARYHSGGVVSMFHRRLYSGWDFGRLLDVGGGSGAFVIEPCQRYPSLSATAVRAPWGGQNQLHDRAGANPSKLSREVQLPCEPRVAIRGREVAIESDFSS